MNPFGPGQYVQSTFGFDPTRPRSAQFWMSPELRRPSWARPGNFRPSSNVPPSLQGNYPGTPAYPSEAGAGERYGFVRDWMQRMLSFYGAPGPNVAQLDLVDWNDEANMFAARDSIKYQLETLCKVDWTQTPWRSFDAMWESRGGFSDRMWETFRALQSKFCPSFSMRDEAPPAEVVTTTATEVIEEIAPPEAPTPSPGTALGGAPTEAPTPPAEVPAEVPMLYQEPRRKPNLGYWIGGSALILAVMAGAWYLSQRKPRRKRNPKRKENPTMVDHAYEHGFMQGFDAAEHAFHEQNPCSCRNPTPRKRSSPRKTKRRNYAGTTQDPSIQYDILGDARTSLLEDMPGATWKPGVKPNPKRRRAKPKKKRRSKNPKSKSRKNPKGAVCGRRFGKLTAQKRARLPSSAFGLPRSRQYPMPDSSHASLAKGRAKQQLKRRKLSRADYDRIVRKADRILEACK